jgi:uncharacterized ion transporter superfamily protein YfcC
MKKGFKMPTAYTILLSIIAFIALLSWFVPGMFWVGETLVKEVRPQGIINVFYAPMQGFINAADLILFIVVIGGFVGVVMKSGALEAGIGSLLKKAKGNEIFIIPVLMFLFGLGGTTFGMAEETIAFYAIIVPVMLAAGFDIMTAVMVILLGSGAGVLASTVNPFAVGNAVSTAADAGVAITIGDGMLFRWISFIIFEGLAILFTLKYASDVKKDNSKAALGIMADESLITDISAETAPELTRRRKNILIVFALTFVLMVIAVIPWGAYGINVFYEIGDFINDKLWFFATSTGMAPDKAESWTNILYFGDWWFQELSLLFFISTLIIAKIAGMKEKEITESIVDGARDLLGVALIIGVSRGIKVMLVQTGYDVAILDVLSDSLEGMSGALFQVLNYIFFIPMSFLIPSTSGLSGSTFGIVGPLADTAATASGAVTGFSFASGIVNIITPTSGVVMGGLALAKVPYEKWLKHMLPIIGAFFIVSIILLVLGTVLGIA